MRHIVSDGMDILEIINLFMLCSWRAENLDVCLLTRVCYLGDTAAIDGIAFHFQNIKSLVHFLFRNTKLSFDSGSDIDHAFFRNLFFQKFSGLLCLIHTSFGTLIQKRANRRIVSKAHLISDFIQTITLSTKSLSRSDISRTAFILCKAHLGTKLGCTQAHRFCNGYFSCVSFSIFIGKGEIGLFQFLYTGKKITAVLIRVITRTPRITTRPSGHTVMH